MKAKKIISVILTGIVAASMLAGCGSSSRSQTDNTESSSQNEASSSSVSETADATEGSENTETTESTDTSENTETPTPAETDDSSETAVADDTESTGKTLVVYYSATGTTEGVAQTIADTTGGDLFEIQPVEPYTDDELDWTNDDSRVSREHDDESLRDVDLVSTSVDNWDSYDTVFIGYPIWWGIAAWPVDGFVEANDFTGKTVIPFCTAASSGIGDSGNLLEEMAGTGNWLEGKRLDRGISEDEVKDWISDLGISSVEN